MTKEQRDTLRTAFEALRTAFDTQEKFIAAREAARVAQQKLASASRKPVRAHNPSEEGDPPYGARNRRGELLDAFDAYKEWRGE